MFRDAVYRLAVKLMDAGVDPDEVMDALMSGNAYAALKELESEYSF